MDSDCSWSFPAQELAVPREGVIELRNFLSSDIYLVLKVNKGSGQSRKVQRKIQSVLLNPQRIYQALKVPESQMVGGSESTREGTPQTLALSLCIMHMLIATFGDSELGQATCAAVLSLTGAEYCPFTLCNAIS